MLAMLLTVIRVHCCVADTAELRYTRALVDEAMLEDAVRSLRSALLYTKTAGCDLGEIPAVLAECTHELSHIGSTLQADEPRPNIAAIEFDQLNIRTQRVQQQVAEALRSLRRAPELAVQGPRRPGFAPLPALSGTQSLLNRVVFAALAPTRTWQGWERGSRGWEVLRALDLQAVSPWFGWYAKSADPNGCVQEIALMDNMLGRLQAAGFPALLWLEPQYNVEHLWAEIGEELYLHDSEGQWRARTRINNTINVFHPRVREEVSAWVRELARSQRGDPRILGYELVEEPALRFDISDPDSSERRPRLGCYSQAAQAAFRRRLQSKYGTIAELNRTWASDYEDFQSIRPPAQLSRTEGEWQGPEVALLAEFQEFRAVEHAEYFREMVAALHEGKPDAFAVPQFTTGLFGDPLGAVDLFRMSEAGWDLITFHTLGHLGYVHSVARYARRPIWNDEYIWSACAPREATGEKRLRAVASIHLWRNLMWGAQGLVLFNLDFPWEHPKDGGDWNNDLLNDQLGDLAPRYAAGVFPQVLRKVPSLFAELYDSEVVDEGVMILEPTSSIYTAVPTGTSQWWATQIADELGRVSYRPAFCPERYLTTGREDLSTYRVLVVPVGTYMPEEVCRRLWEWTCRGGVLIAVGRFATHDNFGKPRPRSAPFGELRAGDTTAVGAGYVVSIPLGGAPSRVVSDVRRAVNAAVGEREAVVSDTDIELMLRRLPDGGRLLVALNANPDRPIQTQVTLAGSWADVTDVTIEHGIRVPCAREGPKISIALILDPGEARVFILH